MLDMLIKAYERINDLEVKTAYLEAMITDLKAKLSRKPKIKTAQVQLILNFDLEEAENESICM
jgi:uncharacterized coiled-coil protein SlyX